MATVNLGSIKFNWKGSYSGATAYVVDDVVESSGSSYICIAATTGNAPPNATYWELMSNKGTDADLLNIASTVQGDIYYNSGGAIARLGAGTSGQALITNGTGANPSWGDVSGGLLQSVMGEATTEFSTTSSSFTSSNLELNITPSSTSSKILIMANFLLYNSGSSCEATFYRNGSNIISSPAEFVRLNTDSAYDPPSTMMYLDSPNSTSNQNYIVYVRCSTSGTTYLSNDQARGIIIAQEIGV